MDWAEFVKLYGPLAIGWVVAFFLWQELKTHIARYHEEKERDIEVKANMLNALQNLTDIIKS
jgi:hypothetical protein|tara:strand:- start:3981 stop:4166 length:186 start_codon:yes stop_codon:yes gene_type:complete